MVLGFGESCDYLGSLGTFPKCQRDKSYWMLSRSSVILGLVLEVVLGLILEFWEPWGSWKLFQTGKGINPAGY